MTIHASARIGALLLSLSVGACAFDTGSQSEDVGAAGQKTPGGIAFSRACAKTQCEADCEVAAAKDCSECNAACFSVMTGTGSMSCIDTCASVCQPSCGCSDDSPCVKVGYEFDYSWPADESVATACKLAGDCFFDPGWCYNDSIILDPEKAFQYYECEKAHCDGSDDAVCLPAGGNLGQILFDTGCEQIPESAIARFSGWTQMMRREVRETLEWCFTLGSCSEIEGCMDGALHPSR